MSSRFGSFEVKMAKYRLEKSPQTSHRYSEIWNFVNLGFGEIYDGDKL